MKNLVDVLCWLIGIIALGTGVYFFYLFATNRNLASGRPDPTAASTYLYYAIAATIVFVVCGVISFLRHVNKEEEIHITQ